MAGMGADLFIGGAITSILGTIANVTSNVKNLQIREQVDDANAKQFTYQSQLATQNAAAKYALQQRNFSQRLATIKTRTLESGIRPNSYGNLVNEASLDAGMDQMNTLLSGQQESYYYKSAANYAQFDKQVAESSLPVAILGGIFQGAATGLNASSLFYKPRQTVNQDVISRFEHGGF